MLNELGIIAKFGLGVISFRLVSTTGENTSKVCEVAHASKVYFKVKKGLEEYVDAE